MALPRRDKLKVEVRKMKKNVLSVIMPAHAEEARIAKTLKDYDIYFSKEYHQNFEMTVILDGCVDRTVEIVNEYSSQFSQIKSKTFEQRLGKGGAIREGLKIANGDIILLVDADGATTPKELDKLIVELSDNDGAIGSRWLPESNILRKQSLARRVASRGFNLLVRILFGLPFADTQCGAKAFKKQVVDEVLNQLETTNFAFDVELLYRLKKRGYKIKEVPITWEDKGKSTLDLKSTIPTMFFAVVRLRVLNSPFKRVIENRLSAFIRGRRK